MKSKTGVKRRYDASRRRALAAERQSAVIEAARRLFAERGYAATTMESIADQAGTSVETVYLAFGTKSALLARVVDVALAGDEGDAPLADRPLFLEVREQRDQVRQLQLLARNARVILERAGPLQWTLLLASGQEPEIAELVDRYHRRRLEVMTEFMRWVAANGPLAPGLSVEEAARTYWTLSGTEVHHLLRVRLGYSPDDYEHWLARQLVVSLLPH